MKRQGFSGKIRLVFTPGIKDPHLEYPFRYVDKKGRTHTCPEGMKTDGLSIPRFFWRLIDPPIASDYLAAALIHDRICDDARDIWNAGNKTEARTLRKQGDVLFKEMLEYLDCPKWKVIAMYRGVRIGAMSLHKNKRAKDIQ